ncbi:MAG: diaminopimelate decarboxylase [Planctomycetes bacterium]|nr:diaminopimelate decarboxylase [Planctomycetota bacterium]
MSERRRFEDSGTDAFHLRAGCMWCEELPVEALAAAHGTPLYVYSTAAMRRRLDELRAAFGAGARICYAVKANPNLSLLRLFAAWDLDFDVVSIGELERVIAAVGPLREDRGPRVVFAGAAKRRDEIVAAHAAGCHVFHVESAHELPWLAAAAQRSGRVARIALRLNPDVAADTHRYIATGRGGDKFGMAFDAAAQVVAALPRLPELRLVGYHVHVGSQIRDHGVYLRAFDNVAAWLDADPARSAGIESFDLGGGFGIAYGDTGERCDVARVARELSPRLAARGLTPMLEPGRYLVGDAGVLLTTVIAEKRARDRRLVLVDAAMNDLLRPSLYGARHPIHPVRDPAGAARTPCDVVGPVCESGDFLGRDVPLRTTEPGELLAVLAAGAYGSSMASNYNSRPRPAEVLVDGGEARVVRRRERLEDLWSSEVDEREPRGSL